MFLFAATLAHAGLRADLDRESRDAPTVAFACSDARDGIARFSEMLTGLSSIRPIPPEALAALSGVQAMSAPGGRLGISFWSDGSMSRIGFDTPLDAAAFAAGVAALDPSAGAEPRLGPDGWRVVDAAGEEVRVGVVNGWGTITSGDIRPGETRLPAPLLAALPDDGGCLLAGFVPNKDLGDVLVTFHLPTERGRPASYAIQVPRLQDAPAVLLQGAAPPAVATPRAPEALLILGLGLDDIDFSLVLKGNDLREARRLQRMFPVTGGTTLALLASSPTPKLAAVVPFSRRLPASVIARRTQRVLRMLDVPIQRVDATRFVAGVGAKEIAFAAVQGRLYVATEAETLLAMERGEGQPWVTPAIAAIAAEWPIVFTSNIIAGLEGAPRQVLPRPILITLDVDGGIVKGLMDVPLEPAHIMHLTEELADERATKDARTSAEARGRDRDDDDRDDRDEDAD